jgi:long-subunit acyl-CoA synthetase (AMP-forming)
MLEKKSNNTHTPCPHPRSEYLFVEQAFYTGGCIVISIYTTSDAATIHNVLEVTQAEVLVVDNLESIQSLPNRLLPNNQIKEILGLDEANCDDKSKIQPLSAIFKTMKSSDVCERLKIDPDSVGSFILTSSTTGRTNISRHLVCY